jgi:glycosyltransferase involved in cell wall biosynthesis
MVDKIEILLMTYNRAKDLEKTLQQLLKSPFFECKITVLDNCSPDETPSVCNSYAKLFPRFKSVRHKINIGGDPNYLRAVELSESVYTWILGDDDFYDFTQSNELIEAIRLEKADIFIVGTPANSEWARGLLTTTGELNRRGLRYFHIFAFIPNVIFRTSLFDTVTLYMAYRNIANLFPHLALANKSLEENSSVYIVNKDIIRRSAHNEATYSPLFHITSWVNSCQMIKDKKLRKKVIYQIFDNKVVFFKKIVSYILYAKATRYDKLTRRVAELLLGLSKTQRLMLAVTFPLLIFPASFYLYLLHIYSKYSLSGKTLPKTPWTDPWSW